MVRKWFVERNTRFDWENPGRGIRIGWPFLRTWNETLVTMMNLAAHSEGLQGNHVAVVQIHPLAPSTTRRGDVRFLRALEGASIRRTSIYQDSIHFVSARDVRRLAIDIARATAPEQRERFSISRTPARHIARHIIEDALALITAGSLAGQMGVSVDENQLIRKQRGILSEFNKRRDAR